MSPRHSTQSKKRPAPLREEAGQPRSERRTEMLEYPKKVLLATDGTEDSARAASVADMPRASL